MEETQEYETQVDKASATWPLVPSPIWTGDNSVDWVRLPEGISPYDVTLNRLQANFTLKL